MDGWADEDTDGYKGKSAKCSVPHTCPPNQGLRSEVWAGQRSVLEKPSNMGVITSQTSTPRVKARITQFEPRVSGDLR